MAAPATNLPYSGCQSCGLRVSAFVDVLTRQSLRAQGFPA